MFLSFLALNNITLLKSKWGCLPQLSFSLLFFGGAPSAGGGPRLFPSPLALGFGFGFGLWMYFWINSFNPCISFLKDSKHFLSMYEEFSIEHGSLKPLVKLYPISVWTCILEGFDLWADFFQHVFAEANTSGKTGAGKNERETFQKSCRKSASFLTCGLQWKVPKSFMNTVLLSLLTGNFTREQRSLSSSQKMSLT